MMTKKVTSYIRVEIDPNNIIEDLFENLSYKDIIEFIKNIDREADDWDFTLKLCDYFKEQKGIYNNENDSINTNNGVWRV